jgi:hypothetical protein
VALLLLLLLLLDGGEAGLAGRAIFWGLGLDVEAGMKKLGSGREEFCDVRGEPGGGRGWAGSRRGEPGGGRVGAGG